MRFKVAMAQLLARENDVEFNLLKGLKACEEAKDMFADLIVFPEIWQIGFSKCPVDESGMKNWEDRAIDVDNEFLIRFREKAKELGLSIAISCLQKDIQKPKNSMVVFNNEGNIVLNYSKVFICNFGREELNKVDPVLDELGCDFNCSTGTEFPVCELEGNEGVVKVGALICADREFPEAAGELVKKGVEIVVVPNSCDWDDLKEQQVAARVFEGICGMAVVNYPSPKNNGGSTAHQFRGFDDDGFAVETLIVKSGCEEELAIADFDVDKIREQQLGEKWRLNYRKSFKSMSFNI